MISKLPVVLSPSADLNFHR